MRRYCIHPVRFCHVRQHRIVKYKTGGVSGLGQHEHYQEPEPGRKKSKNNTAHNTDTHGYSKNNLFKTKMDFVIFKDNKAIILDAKWKELNSTSDKFDVAQADLYQLFAYSELIKNNKAEVEEVEIILLYPESDKFKEKVIKWEYFNNTPVSIVPINVVEKENNQLFLDELGNYV